ncbi:MAG: putative sugar nucleotidyl transferase, partial [bacterium]
MQPVYELRCGIFRLREKIAHCFPGSRIHLFCRDYLADGLRETTAGVTVNEIPPTPCLFINGRFI